MNKSLLLRSQISILLALSLAPSMVHAGAATVETATKDQISAATDLYERGVIAFDAGKNDEALTLFSRCNDIVTSPNSRMMVGRTLAKLGRLPEAYRELTESIKLASAQKRYKKTAETAKHELEEISPKLAFVKVRSAAKVQIQGQTIPELQAAELVPVLAGVVTVDVTFRDGTRKTRQLTVKPGEHAEFELDAPIEPAATAAPLQTPVQASTPKDAPQSDNIRRKSLGYVIGTVGVVGLGAFVGFGIIGAGTYSNAKGNCVQQICPASAVDREGTRSFYQGIGYSGLAIGVLGVGAGAWLILSSSSGAEASTTLHAGPFGVNLSSRF